MTNFKSVVIDVDSTLCGIEGIDWLARRRSDEVSADVTGLTEKAMNGEIELDAIYAHRLKLVAPSRNDLEALGAEYERTMVPNAPEVIQRLKEAGVDVHLVSGGLLPAIRVAAKKAGVPDGNVHAVGVTFDDGGRYSTFDHDSPLTKQNGKQEVVRSLHLGRPSLMVGDGATDAEVRPAVDAFAAFTGFARRDAAVAHADYVVSSFEEILSLVTQ